MGGEIERLQSILKQDPSNFQVRRELSVILANEGFNEEALGNLKYLEKYFPQDADIAYNMGIIYEKLKDFPNAKIAYEKAVRLAPMENDFYYNLGEVLVNLREWDAAIEVFKHVLLGDSNDGNCYFNLGICYLNKEEFNQASDNFQKAVELNPKDIFAYFYLGNIYQRSGLTNFAEDCYKKVLEISPDYSWAYYNLASIAYQNGNIEEAKSNLLLTIQYNDQDIDAYKLLTKIYLMDNDTENILTILHSRLEKEENGDLYYILAQVYRHIGKQEEYIHNLDMATKNTLTLTYPHETVREELKYMTSKFGIQLEPPKEMDEYSESDDDFDGEEYEEDEYSEDYENDSDEEYDEDDTEEDSSEDDDNFDGEDEEYAEVEDSEYDEENYYDDELNEDSEDEDE